MKIKRLVSCFISIMLVISAADITFAAEKDNTTVIYLNDASALYDKQAVQNVKMGLQSAVTLTNRKGIKCWQLKSANRMNAFVNVNLSDEFAGSVSDGTYFEIEVEYFDEGKGVFCLEYDSQKSTDCETDAVYLANTMQWKTHVFQVDDAYFADRHWNNTSDFSITVRSDKLSYSMGNVCVSKITVTKFPKLKPVQCVNVKSGETGNIFGNSDSKEFSAEFKNFSDEEKTVNVSYEVFDDYCAKVWSNEDTIKISAGESVQKEIKPDVNRYCLYDLKVVVSDENYIQTKTVPFSYINTIEDGTKNDYAGYCTKFTLDGYEADDGMPIVAKSGSGFVRNSVQWTLVDAPGTAKGNFALTQNAKSLFSNLAKYGIKWQWLVGMGNTKYGMKTTNTIPTTEEQLAAFENYIDFMIDEKNKYGVKMNSYEIWNEPNIQPFNSAMENGKTYGEFAVRMLNKIRERDSLTPSTMFSVCNLTTSSAREFYSEALSAVPRGFLNAATLHPYNHNSIPEKGVALQLKSYADEFNEKMGTYPKLYHTEVGYFSGSGSAADPKVQAEYNMRTYVYFKGNKIGDYFSWYNLDNEGGIKTYTEHNFGHTQSCKPVYDYPYAAKETYVAVTAVNKILQNADSTGTVLDNGTDYAYTFVRPKDNKKIIPFWTAGSPKNVTFKLNTNNAVLYDIYGNPTALSSENGEYTLTLTNSMQYLEGDFTAAECTEPRVETSENNLNIAKNSSVTIDINGVHDGEILTASRASGADVYVEKNNLIGLKCENEVGGSDIITVKISKNDKTSSIIKIPLKTTEPFTAELYADIRGKDDVTRWDATLYVTNNMTVPLDAKVHFLSPAMFADNYGTIGIDTIPAGCIGEYKLKLPRINELGIYDNVVYTIEANDGTQKTFKQSIDFTCAVYAEKKPDIDGKMSDGEWDLKTTMNCGSEEQVSMTGNNVWNGPDDLSAATNIMFDNDNFYLFVRVRDDIKAGSSTDSLIWQNDSIQFGIAFEKKLHDAVVGGSFTEITFGDTPNGPLVWRHSSEGNNMPLSKVETAQLAITRDNGVTNYELAIPWSEITTNKVDFDTIDKIGFAMVVNDDDGNTRKGWIEYAGGIARQKDSSQFTYLCIAR